VNADGTNLTIIDPGNYVRHPLWSDDGKTIHYIRFKHDLGRTDDEAGFPSTWLEGKRSKECDVWLYGAGPTSNSNEILVARGGNVIERLRLSDCKVTKTYIDVDPTGEQSSVINRLSISMDDQYLAYSVQSLYGNHRLTFMYLLNVESGTTFRLDEGGNPLISPKGDLIAYGLHGSIYVVGINGQGRRKVLDEEGNGSFVWSPDQEWLLYHKCNSATSACDRIEDYGIYKLRIADGAEFKVANGGLWPYWRDRKK
jgi:Tol biopolymer transport system component